MMDRLPDELLWCIGEYIRTGWHGQNDLNSLIRCCRHFHQLFQPLLYAHISLHHFSDRSPGLVMRICQDPSLARQVRRLDLGWYTCEDWGPENDGRDADTKAAASAFCQDALDEIFGPKDEEDAEGEEDDEMREGNDAKENEDDEYTWWRIFENRSYDDDEDDDEDEKEGEEEGKGEDEEEEKEDDEQGEEEDEENEEEAEDEEDEEDEEKKMRKEWEEHLITSAGMCEEVWCSLLLVRLTCLQTIEFSHSSAGEPELMRDILVKAARRQRPFHQEGPHPFAHLQEVLAETGCGNDWIESSFLTPFFTFPAVRTVTGTDIGESHWNPDALARELRPASSPVRDIGFYRVLWCRGLQHWLAACKELVSFSIMPDLHREDRVWDEEHLHFNMAELRTALLPFTGTLKTLRVRYGYNYNNVVVYERRGHERAFGSFRDFVVLEDLSVRHDHLVSLPEVERRWAGRPPLIETLPRALASLEITDIVPGARLELLSDLLYLVRQSHLFPKLERLTLVTREDDEEQTGDVFNDLVPECQAAGVSMTVKKGEFLV